MPRPPRRAARGASAPLHLGHAASIARSTSFATACASSSDSSPGSFRWSETSGAVADVTRTVTLCTSRTRADRAARRPAPARGAPRRPRAARRGRRRRSPAARAARPPRPRRPRRGPARPPRPARDADRRRRRSDGRPPGAAAAGAGRPRASSSRDRLARAASCASLGARSMSTSTFRRISRPAAKRTSTATNSAAAESAVRVAGAREQRGRRGRRSSRRGRCRSGARSTAAQRCDSGARARSETTVRLASIAITTQHDGDHPPRGIDVRLAARRRGARARPPAMHEARERRGSRASASAARCSAFPCPYWCATSAGRPATPTAKNVSSAATRSVAEWSASESEAEAAARDAGRRA